MLLSFVCVLCASAVSCAGTPPKVETLLEQNDAEDRAAVEALIEDGIAWFRDKDFDRLYEIFPEDPDLFLFHPDSLSTVVGGKAFRENAEIWRDPQNVYLRHEIKDLRVNFSGTGTVTWWSALLDDCGSYGGKEFCWENCRWTGVAEKREGSWVITQCHFSFAEDEVTERIKREGDRAKEEEYSDYQKMRGRVGELFGLKEYEAAADILKRHIDQFPDHVMANTYNLSLAAAMQQDAESAIYWLEEGLRRGIFFGIWAFEDEVWGFLADQPRFKVLVEANAKLLAAVQGESEMKLEVIKPPNYNSKKRYPLFIALHGGGETIETFRPRWTSPRLQREFVVAYVQSSQVASMDGFHWQGDDITEKELRKAYKMIDGEASIDPNQIYIGGFSSGGYGSVQVVLNGAIKVRGFVILCPVLPENPSEETLAPLVERNVRGTLLTTELDGRVDRQKEFSDYLTEKGVPLKMVMTPNMGHWYPDNLPELIDDALADMMQ